MSMFNKSMPNARIVATIQARLGSTRLPQKALKRIQGKTLTEWIAYRLSFAREVDEVILATADTEENDPLAKHGREIGLPVYRGSEVDLIARLLEAAKKYQADAIVRITGDCPLVDPVLVDRIVREFKAIYPNVDYISNINPPTFPDGMDVEVIATHTLERLDREVQDPLRREWLTTTLMEGGSDYRTKNIYHESNLAHLRLTVDYPEDFVLTSRIFERLYQPWKVFGLDEIISLFDSDRELPYINAMRSDMVVENNIRSAEFHRLNKKI